MRFPTSPQTVPLDIIYTILDSCEPASLQPIAIVSKYWLKTIHEYISKNFKGYEQFDIYAKPLNFDENQPNLPFIFKTAQKITRIYNRLFAEKLPVCLKVPHIQMLMTKIQQFLHLNWIARLHSLKGRPLEKDWFDQSDATLLTNLSSKQLEDCKQQEIDLQLTFQTNRDFKLVNNQTKKIVSGKDLLLFVYMRSFSLDIRVTIFGTFDCSKLANFHSIYLCNDEKANKTDKINNILKNFINTSKIRHLHFYRFSLKKIPSALFFNFKTIKQLKFDTRFELFPYELFKLEDLKSVYFSKDSAKPDEDLVQKDYGLKIDISIANDLLKVEIKKPRINTRD